MLPATRFCFESYGYDHVTGQARFEYSLDNGARFTERLTLPANTPNPLDQPGGEQILHALHLALGISYWKLWCPAQIELRTAPLSRQQATFWNTLYTKGLGEFFYTNQIDFRDLVQFPYAQESTARPIMQRATEKTGKLLVPLGGGKDSLTTVSLLQQHDLAFDTYALNHYPIIDAQAAQLPGKHHVITRQLDHQLKALNQLPGVYNGHVPISSIYAFTAVLLAIAVGYTDIVLSNERSANVGNLIWHDSEINHQWSKSLEFEIAIQHYIANWITSNVEYFSLLRPLSELHITKLFTQDERWLQQFTSCNRNFTQDKTTSPKTRWCGQCAKCLFVFISLAAFVPKAKLLIVFGKNLLDDDALWPLLEELLGLARNKPFDCVGTPEEVLVACDLIAERGEYQQDSLMKKILATVLPSTSHLSDLKQVVFTPSTQHRVPEQFQSLLPLQVT